MKKVLTIECGGLIRELKKLDFDITNLTFRNIDTVIDTIDDKILTGKELDRLIDLLIKLLNCISRKIEGILYTVIDYKIISTQGSKLVLEVSYDVH